MTGLGPANAPDAESHDTPESHVCECDIVWENKLATRADPHALAQQGRD